MTYQQLEKLELGINKTDIESCLLVEAAIEWIENNTTVKVDVDNIANTQAGVRLFISKYIEIMSLPIGVTSESASGLSQSFDSSDKSDLLFSLASTILGDDVLTAGKVRFVSSSSRWE